MKKKIICALLGAIAMFAGISVNAQNSLPAPGSGGAFTPNNGGGVMGPANGIGWNPGPAYPAYWGNPWNNGWNYTPSVPVNSPVVVNQGITKVLACGYDITGVWRILPLTVSYQWNGVDYNVNVINAWNPWTDSWNRGVDEPAYSTSYVMRGVTYNYYTVLTTGTYYFNL